MLRSQIAVNVHIGVAGGLAGNMRMFEATGCGALLLTEEAPNLAELFAPGEEVVSYTGVDDLVGKIKHYLARPEDAARIAAAGQRRTHSEYSTQNRARELERVFKDLSRVT
jgi:spore maturation protein CgeB